MIKALLAIYEAIKKIKLILNTIWFAVHGVIRFVFRLPAALALFVSSLPVWAIPVATICFIIGFAVVILGRN